MDGKQEMRPIKPIMEIAKGTEFLIGTDEGFQFLKDVGTLLNDANKPTWTYRFEVTVHADTEEEAIRLGRIDAVFNNGDVRAIRQ